VLIGRVICDCLTGTDLKALHEHLSGGTEGNHKEIVSGWLVSYPIFAPDTSQVQVQASLHEPTSKFIPIIKIS